MSFKSSDFAADSFEPGDFLTESVATTNESVEVQESVVPVLVQWLTEEVQEQIDTEESVIPILVTWLTKEVEEEPVDISEEVIVEVQQQQVQPPSTVATMGKRRKKRVSLKELGIKQLDLEPPYEQPELLPVSQIIHFGYGIEPPLSLEQPVTTTLAASSSTTTKRGLSRQQRLDKLLKLQKIILILDELD